MRQTILFQIPLLTAALLIAGCKYGVDVDDEGGVDMRMPGQRMKISKDGGVEIDQGVQKMRVGKEGVDIQQPGQRVTVSKDDGVEIDQGVQKLRVGKEGIDAQQPGQRVQVGSDDGVEIRQATESADIDPKPATATKEAELDASKPQPKLVTTEARLRPESNVDSGPAAAKPSTVKRTLTRKPTVAVPAEDRGGAVDRTDVRPVPRPAAPRESQVKKSPLRVRGEVPAGQQDFSGQSLIQKNLAGRDLRGANFSKARLTQTDLSGCDLSGANFAGASIGQCSFEGAKLANADFTGATIMQGWFSGADFSGAVLREAKLTQVDLRESNLTMTSFHDAHEIQVKKP